MFFYLYKITNIVNNKIYVGVHQTKNIDDGYMGSGKVIGNAIAKYGIGSFKKEILEFFDNPISMFDREKELVNEEFLNRPDVYNIRRGGKGGFDHIRKLPEYKQWVKNGGVAKHEKMSPDQREEFLSFFNSIREKAKNSFDKKLVENNGKIWWESPKGFLGKKHSDETIEKMKFSQKGKHTKEKNSQYGTMWITNDIQNKKIKKEDQIPNGWKKGRTSKNAPGLQRGLMHGTANPEK